MSQRTVAVQVPPLALYILAVSQGDCREYVLSPYIKSVMGGEFLGPHELRQFQNGAERFGQPSFCHQEVARSFINANPKKYRWMAEAMVTMIHELRYCLGALAKAPILVDTGQYQAKYQNRTFADMENEISRDLTQQQNFHAKVKLLTGEYTIRTKPAPETLTANALTERIDAIKKHMRTLGYTRHYLEVEREIRDRQERLHGIIAEPPPATNGHRRPTPAPDDAHIPDEPPPPGSFTLD